ncbi:hypothetical protein, partial [Microbispora amethystogenes]|uniref:hypothetical protein n=1 Tax=Microbispora amethystogenes TaxID=1427754 RepID=UPI0019544AAB
MAEWWRDAANGKGAFPATSRETLSGFTSIAGELGRRRTLRRNKRARPEAGLFVTPNYYCKPQLAVAVGAGLWWSSGFSKGTAI